MSKQPSPTDTRLAHVYDQASDAEVRRPQGVNAWAVLASELRPRTAYSGHQEWMRNPWTQRFIAALRTAALHQPPSLAGGDTKTQYGVTSGLVLAATLLEDPGAVIAGCFTQEPEDSNQAQTVETEYTYPSL